MSEAAIANLRRWKAEPATFVWDVFGCEPDAWQLEMLGALPTEKRIVASACKGPGKTAGMSWCAWNFLLTRPDCKVPCTSITGGNLKDGLWSELAKWHARSPLLQRAFKWTSSRIFQVDRPENWFASARAWPRDADPQSQANTLAGIHADYLLFIVDEVSDIPDGVIAAAEGALTSGIETKLLMSGNPTRTSGPLYRAVTADRSMWKVIRITGDPDDPKRSPRIDIEEARRQIAKYGRESYYVKVNILGEFPDRQADKLLDLKDCEEAMVRVVPEAEFRLEPKVLGLDVARFGDDASVLAFRQGKLGFPLKEFRGLDTHELGDQLLHAIDRWDADAAFIDGTGIGAGVVDYCRHRGYGHVVKEAHFGMKARDEARFENKRSEMYGLCADWVKQGGALPRDPQLTEELCEPVYWHDKRDRICLESKDDIKKRLGRSPDRADGLVLTFASPVRAKPRADRIPYAAQNEGKAATRSNPLERS